ncbi:MAG: bifunctional diaminohydroxyphosphoribosylaminopyrimidine deaminase/5-amino-6-(5-phosphoribosylamino)uracil reductase RibD [Deltaproteobacteria bacterium]|nr:bifunctional diaminohydroxyphosphoribosylaminopyrimidine deaminase/5-amino-6-(5-phosphoribosylamino)uracil reductase RibD [Deltaproteobacteria bacterium]
MTFPRPEFMRLALRLARRGVGKTSPNPAVGAVVVKGGMVVGSGYHRAAGFPHAEVEAIRAAGKRAPGADLYVTLEPCAHRGRTGPCTEEVLAAGIRRVAAAMVDPNPLVSGKGVSVLEGAGVQVVTGLFEREAMALNRPYCRWISTGRPYVTLKLAISLDGQIAGASGESRWISGERSRALAHRMRSVSDAVLVGGGTLRRDDPVLSCRIRGGRDPKRVIVTSRLGNIGRRRLFREGCGEVIIACPSGVPSRDVEGARRLGAKVLSLPSRGGRIAAKDLMSALGKEGITSLLVEGGALTAGWLIAENAVDRFVLFLSPVVLGEGIRAVGGWSARSPAEGKKVVIESVRRVGEDVLVTAVAAPAGRRE